MTEPNGFTGATTLLTSWGACRLHDLARLTTQRDRAAEAYAGKVAALQQDGAQALADFDAAAQQVVDAAPEAEQAALAAQYAADRVALIADQAAIVASLQAAIDSELASRLPALIVSGGEPVPLQGVIASDEAASVVDVAIAEIPIDGQAVPIPVKVRCAPGCMFVTEAGDIAAANLQGAAIHRVTADQSTDTFVVPAAEASVVNPTLMLYLIVADASTCCVGADSMIAAIVRLS